MSDARNHALSEDEYQDWLQDRVSRRVLVRLGTSLSFLGLAGLFGLYQLISGDIDERVRSRIGELRGGIVEEVSKDTRMQVESTVANTLLNLPRINDLVNAEAEKTAKDAIKRATDPEIVVPRLLKQIEQNQQMLDVIARNITKSKTITNALLEPLRPIIVDADKDIRERTAALQFLVIFEDPANVRPIVEKIILDDSTRGTELRSLALGSYPFHRFPIEAPVTAQVLADLADDLENERLVSSYGFFLSRVPADQVGTLVDWIRGHPGHRATPIVEQALAEMNDEDAIPDIALLTAEEDSKVSLVGLRILRQIGSNWRLSEEVRLDTLKRLVEFLASPGSADPFSIRGHLVDLHQAILDEDQSRMTQLKNQQAEWANDALAALYEEVALFIDEESLPSVAELVRLEWPDGEVFANEFVEEMDIGDEVVQYASGQRRDGAREAIAHFMRPDDWESFVFVEVARKKRHPEFHILAGAMFGAWMESFERLGQAERTQVTSYAGELVRLAMEEVPGGLHQPLVAQAVSRALRYATKDDLSHFLTAFYPNYFGFSGAIKGDSDTVSSVLHAAFARDLSLGPEMESSNRFLAAANGHIVGRPDLAETITASLARFVEAPRAAKRQLQLDRRSMVSELIKSNLVNIATDASHKNAWGTSVLEFIVLAERAIDIDIVPWLETHDAIRLLRESSMRDDVSEDARLRAKALLVEVEARLGWPSTYAQVAEPVTVGTAPDQKWSEIASDTSRWLRIDARIGKEYWVEVDGGLAEYLVVDANAAVKARGRLKQQETLEISADDDGAASGGALFIRLSVTRESSDMPIARLAVTEEDRRSRMAMAQTTEQAGEIEIGRLYRGALPGRDSTWVFFNAEQDRAYRIETSRLIGAVDTEISLYGGPQTTRLKSDDDSGSDDLASMIEFVPGTSGPYFLRVMNLEEEGEGKFDLAIEVVDGPLSPD